MSNLNASYTYSQSKNINYTGTEDQALNRMPQKIEDLSYPNENSCYIDINDYNNLFNNFNWQLIENQTIGIAGINACTIILTDAKQAYEDVKQQYPNIELIIDIPNQKLRRKLATFLKICYFINQYSYSPKCEDCFKFHFHYFTQPIFKPWYYRIWNGLKGLLRFN